MAIVERFWRRGLFHRCAIDRELCGRSDAHADANTDTYTNSYADSCSGTVYAVLAIAGWINRVHAGAGKFVIKIKIKADRGIDGRGLGQDQQQHHRHVEHYFEEQ